MHRVAIGLIILPIGLLCGCGGSTSQSALLSPQHGGNIVGLPDSLGFVELTNDRGAPPPKGKQPSKSRIMAYFYGPDATAGMSPTPTDVRVTLGPAGTGTVVKLAPESKEPGAFASESGAYPDQLRGQIDFQFNGKPVQATFSFR